MFKKRVVFFKGDVTPDSAIELISQLLTLEAEAPGEPMQLYDAIVNEAQNRFPAVQLVRLSVRT